MTPEIKQHVRARNLELAREVLVLYERGGLEGMLAEFETYFAPGFEWTPGMVALGRSTYRGRDRYARYVSELAATSVDTKMVDYELRAVGFASSAARAECRSRTSTRCSTAPRMDC